MLSDTELPCVAHRSTVDSTKPNPQDAAIMSNTQQDGAQQPNAQHPGMSQSDAKQAASQRPSTHQPNAGPSNAQQPNIQRPKPTHPNAKQTNAQQSNAQRPDAQPRRGNAQDRGPPQRQRSKTSKFKSALKSGRDFLSDVASCVRIIPCCMLEGCLCLYDLYAASMCVFCAGLIVLCNCAFYCLVLGGRDELTGRFVAWEWAKEKWRKVKGRRNRR